VVGTTLLPHGLDKLGDPSSWEQFFAAAGFELLLLLAGASLTLVLAGPGRHSVDAASGLGRQLTGRISGRSSAGAVT
jgi:uncharacterized membrane protein YphA (DoxX/SURF4 family)